jgi:uncharacterized membrane protein YphA (DoxX/SURF4 family)
MSIVDHIASDTFRGDGQRVPARRGLIIVLAWGSLAVLFALHSSERETDRLSLCSWPKPAPARIFSLSGPTAANDREGDTLDNRIPRSLLLILRIHLGVILLLTVLGKLTGDQPFSAEMLSFVQWAMGRTGIAWYQHFLRDVVVPNASLFSYLVMAGELIAGISLLTGTATRLGGAIGMILFVNYMWAKGRWFWSPDSEDAAVFFSALVVMLGAAGRVAGFDVFLARRWPKGLVW